MNDKLLIMVFYRVFCKIKHRQQNSSGLLKSYLHGQESKNQTMFIRNPLHGSQGVLRLGRILYVSERIHMLQTVHRVALYLHVKGPIPALWLKRRTVILRSNSKTTPSRLSFSP